MHIVKATLSDVDELVRISRKTFYDAFHELNSSSNMDTYMNNAFTRERLSIELTNTDSAFYLVKNSVHIMGYFKLNRKEAQTEFKDDTSMEIERIYIDADHQGKGVGTEMINHVKLMAVEEGIRYIWLGVWEKNPDAIRFYERNGFEVFSSHEFQMGDEVQIDKLMICKIH